MSTLTDLRAHKNIFYRKITKMTDFTVRTICVQVLRDFQKSIKHASSLLPLKIWNLKKYGSTNINMKYSCIFSGDIIKRWGRVPFLPGPTPPPFMVSSPRCLLTTYSSVPKTTHFWWLWRPVCVDHISVLIAKLCCTNKWYSTFTFQQADYLFHEQCRLKLSKRVYGSLKTQVEL